LCGEGAVGLLGGFGASLIAVLLDRPPTLSLAAVVAVVTGTAFGGTIIGS